MVHLQQQQQQPRVQLLVWHGLAGMQWSPAGHRRHRRSNQASNRLSAVHGSMPARSAWLPPCPTLAARPPSSTSTATRSRRDWLLRLLLLRGLPPPRRPGADAATAARSAVVEATASRPTAAGSARPVRRLLRCPPLLLGCREATGAARGAWRRGAQHRCSWAAAGGWSRACCMAGMQ